MQNTISINRTFSFLVLILISLLISCSGDLTQILLLEDEFDQLPTGYISSSSGANTKFHYLAGSGQSGPWTISSFGWETEYSTAWEMVEGESGNFLSQNFHTVDDNLKPLNRHTHPMIVAGDSIWHDYKVEFSFSPKKLLDKCGIVFKYQNDRCYYFYGMEGNMVVIKMIQDATAPYRPFEKVLASAPYNWQAGKTYKAFVSIKENRIYTLLDDSLSLFAEDNTYERGKVGFLSDVPANFYSMKVTTLNREKRKMNRYRTQIANAASIRINENPEVVLWKKISTQGFGTGRNVRFGELNGDGEIDILIGQVVQHGPGDIYSELVCLTAMTFDGEMLWQKGTPTTENSHITSDAAFQVIDIDDDGAREVIYTMDFMIHIVDGKTGRLIKRVPTPRARIPASKYSRIFGDCIYFCDLQGKGRASDFLIKDRYSNVWAYDEHLKLLWTQTLNTGHYPYAYDIDNDSKDEIAIGYSLLDDDGSILWTKDDVIGDHANAVMVSSTIVPEDSTIKIFYAASDWGMMILDANGNIIKHHSVGHVQNSSIANFRNDLKGLEMVSVNFWGSQGIIHIYNSKGEIYNTFEPGPYGSMCFPVNWKGDGEEYFLLNTNPGDGGMFNGNGLLAVPFPDDNHPDLCNAVLDLSGDSRDEIVTWDENEIWIYTQNDNPRQGRMYNPDRNPLYNSSNYQFSISKPGWNE